MRNGSNLRLNDTSAKLIAGLAKNTEATANSYDRESRWQCGWLKEEVRNLKGEKATSARRRASSPLREGKGRSQTIWRVMVGMAADLYHRPVEKKMLAGCGIAEDSLQGRVKLLPLPDQGVTLASFNYLNPVWGSVAQETLGGGGSPWLHVLILTMRHAMTSRPTRFHHSPRN